jgi:ribosomal protein L1
VTTSLTSSRTHFLLGSRAVCTNHVLYASPGGGGSGSGGSSGGGGSSASLSGTAKAKLEKEKRAKKRRSKNLQIRVRSGPTFHIDDALRLVRSCATAAFDETVDFQIQLAVDPRKPNQNVRGIAQLPYGTGKALSIAVFARGEKAEEARRAGATIVGAEDLVERISKGDLNFTKTIATPDMMPLVGKIARVRLGDSGATR